VAAEAAFSLRYFERQDGEVAAANDFLTTRGAEGAVALVTGHVADVDIVEPHLVSDVCNAILRTEVPTTNRTGAY
jgi:hypothetical protein